MNRLLVSSCHNEPVVFFREECLQEAHNLPQHHLEVLTCFHRNSEPISTEMKNVSGNRHTTLTNPERYNREEDS